MLFCITFRKSKCFLRNVFLYVIIPTTYITVFSIIAKTQNSIPVGVGNKDKRKNQIS